MTIAYVTVWSLIRGSPSKMKVCVAGQIWRIRKGPVAQRNPLPGNPLGRVNGVYAIPKNIEKAWQHVIGRLIRRSTYHVVPQAGAATRRLCDLCGVGKQCRFRSEHRPAGDVCTSVGGALGATSRQKNGDREPRKSLRITDAGWPAGPITMSGSIYKLIGSSEKKALILGDERRPPGGSGGRRKASERRDLMP